MKVKLFMIDVTYSNVVVHLDDKCYTDTLSNFYADYKKCDFGSIRNMQHNFLSGEIIIDDEHSESDPFQEIGLDALDQIDVLLDKQNNRRNPPPATLEEARELKLEELAQVTAKFEDNLNKDMYFTSSLGFRVNGDRRTRSNIEDLIRFSKTFPVQYKDYDNIFQKVTKDHLETMLQEHITNGLNLYQQKFSYESQIDACTTIEEVEAIKIKFEMMDFSKSNTLRLKAEALTDYVIRKYIGTGR